ncbi:hypothetical protein ACHAWF_011270 [Thalassiosira exigua]
MANINERDRKASATMVAVKGNDGKAARMKMSTQFLVIFVIAVVAVAAIKTFGSGSWHAKAIMEDQQQPSKAVDEGKLKIANLADAVAEEAKDAAQDKNMIKFVFGNLDGEAGKEGEVVVKLHPEWAPLGVTQIQELTADSFWDGCRAFRVLPKFIVQLGINGDPKVQQKWRQNIADDPVKASNTRGTVTFAMAGKGTRTTQIFFNTKDNSRLDEANFAPFGEVIRGMEIVNRIYAGYRQKPNQVSVASINVRWKLVMISIYCPTPPIIIHMCALDVGCHFKGLIQSKGNEYLEKNFPKMSFIKSASFISSAEAS